MKFGPIKRQHGRVQGLDALLDHILAHCPGVDRIIPGRMGRKAGKTIARLKIQYPTTTANKPTGFKCIYTSKGNWQEVFLICSDPQKTEVWLQNQPFTQKSDD
jgi:hypothetical protein